MSKPSGILTLTCRPLGGLTLDQLLRSCFLPNDQTESTMTVLSGLCTMHTTTGPENANPLLETLRPTVYYIYALLLEDHVRCLT